MTAISGKTTIYFAGESEDDEALLHELLPKASTIAALVNPTFPGSDNQTRQLQEAAGTLGLQLHVLHASNEHEINTAFTDLARLQAKGLVVGNDPVFTAPGANKSPRQRSVTPCPQSMSFARS